VSSYLAVWRALDNPLEIRGPIGGWFVWRAAQTEPVQLVAGVRRGALMAMVRARSAHGAAHRPAAVLDPRPSR